jgi:hypothetical protein
VQWGLRWLVVAPTLAFAGWWDGEAYLEGLDPEALSPIAHWLHGTGDPLTSIFGAVGALGAGLGMWLIASPRPVEPYLPHAWGAWLLRAVSLTATGTTLARFVAFQTDSFALRTLVDSLWLPATVLALFLGFAYVGRLLRHVDDGRHAQLADAVAVGGPLLLVATEIAPSGPPTAVQIASAGAIVCGAWCLVRLHWVMRKA